MTRLLRWMARAYGFAIALRLALYRTHYRQTRRLRQFTISIGNLTTGGTGKTPLVEYVARLLIAEGHRVSILTRGYGRVRNRLQVVLRMADGPLPEARLAGDEPVMMARHLQEATVVVNRDRYAGGVWAESHAGVTMHLMDDGYQHIALDRDLNLLVIDAERPFDSGELIPLGRLREPLHEIARATAVILTRTDRPFDQGGLESQIRRFAGDPALPIFHAYHDVVALWSPAEQRRIPPLDFERKKVAALCAIARPELFADDLGHYGMNVVHTLTLRDHARFTHSVLVNFFSETQVRGAEAILTTEKDWVRLEGQPFPVQPPLWVAMIEARMADEAAFRNYLLQSISRFKPRPPS
ncbi:MAG: tetraacyldisaccharide 4'-kinase [Acidobacteria bacterium]|nr:tetraacyldisaccharide 4'-kinase [Acidobacteriota bacterium]